MTPKTECRIKAGISCVASCAFLIGTYAIFAISREDEDSRIFLVFPILLFAALVGIIYGIRALLQCKKLALTGEYTSWSFTWVIGLQVLPTLASIGLIALFIFRIVFYRH